ncbi:MAG: hypothetical protein IT389_03270 [Nitrospira sp.]|nr:hypothetical protein [Nitrospira sp.]
MPVAACLLCSGFLFSLPSFAQNVKGEHLLQTHCFNQACEEGAFYLVTSGPVLPETGLLPRLPSEQGLSVSL